MADSNSVKEPAKNPLNTTTETYVYETKPTTVAASTQLLSNEYDPDERRFLIECVREHPCVYDKEHRDYRAVEVKDAAWREISTKTGIPVHDAMTKYHTTRTNFGRYVRSIEANTGCSREEVYLKPNYEHLRWLLKYMDVRPGARGLQYRRRYNLSEMGSEIRHPRSNENVDVSQMMWKWNVNEAESFEIETEGSENLSYGEDHEGSLTHESSLLRRKSGNNSFQLQQQGPQQDEPKPKKPKTDDFESQLLQSLKDDSFPTDMPGNASSACTWLAIKLRLKKLSPYQQNLAQARFLQVLTDIEYGPKYPQKYSSQPGNTD